MTRMKSPALLSLRTLLPAAAMVAMVGTACLLATGCGDNGGKTTDGTDSTAVDPGTDPGTTQPAAPDTVLIGGKVWMAKNLNVEVEGGNSWCYEDDSYYCKKYGRLYDWNTAKTACPAGWHLPDNQEWDALVTAAGGASVAGTKLKAQGGWMYNGVSGAGSDEFGFAALAGGARFSTGKFGGGGFEGYWWTATEYNDDNAHHRSMSCQNGDVAARFDIKVRGHSVRCVKD